MSILPNGRYPGRNVQLVSEKELGGGVDAANKERQFYMGGVIMDKDSVGFSHFIFG